MRIVFSDRFVRDYAGLPRELRARIDKQIEMLASNPDHPSLDLKKMSGVTGIWRVKVTGGYRITLRIERDVAVLRRVGPHDILKTP
ncbi:MAG: type II toxin-antitoxin system RelE/ParE family toxin [Deltaproteobacteria bacterium]|nr:type II toxin-antitoxin system RelE/ParE family toxin [Deltaproteobacteria bacterium]